MQRVDGFSTAALCRRLAHGFDETCDLAQEYVPQAKAASGTSKWPRASGVRCPPTSRSAHSTSSKPLLWYRAVRARNFRPTREFRPAFSHPDRLVKVCRQQIFYQSYQATKQAVEVENATRGEGCTRWLRTARGLPRTAKPCAAAPPQKACTQADSHRQQPAATLAHSARSRDQ
jgi:hypothetical protein